MARPFWSGQLRISLVAFGIQLFPATEAKSEIRFHQLNRSTGERVKHQNVSGEDEPVQKDEIVKGYEYSKGQYVTIEPEEIENLRVPSRQMLDVTQFVEASELGPEFFEKPYFVTPENPGQAEAFSVVRQALSVTGKIALGKIAFGGREHLIAITPSRDGEGLGMIAYTMRYAQELRNPADYFASIPEVQVDEEQLKLAKELIQRYTRKFEPTQFTDEYESALRDLIEAKMKHVPIPKDKPETKTAKVINLMDALRKSVQAEAGTKSKRVKEAKSVSSPPRPVSTTGNLTLVRDSRRNTSKPVKSLGKNVAKRKQA